MQYYAVPAEGIDLVLDVKSTDPIQVRVADISYGLPDGATPALARPETVAPLPGRFSNSTLVTKTFSF